MSSATKAYDWLREVDPESVQQSDTPVMGNLPEIPWEPLTQYIQQALGLADLKLERKDLEWRSDADLQAGIGENVHPLHLALAPTSGSLVWLMDKKDLSFLMGSLLSRDGNGAVSQDPDFFQSFYRFCALEVMHALEQLKVFKGQSPRLVKGEGMPSGSHLCLDIGVTIQGQSAWGRLCISQEFRNNWNQQFAASELASLSMEAAAKTSTDLHFVLGESTLSFDEFKGVKAGDLILLDSHTGEPGAAKQKVTVSAAGRSLFMGEFENGQVRLSDFIGGEAGAPAPSAPTATAGDAPQAAAPAAATAPVAPAAAPAAAPIQEAPAPLVDDDDDDDDDDWDDDDDDF